MEKIIRLTFYALIRSWSVAFRTFQIALGAARFRIIISRQTTGLTTVSWVRISRLTLRASINWPWIAINTCWMTEFANVRALIFIGMTPTGRSTWIIYFIKEITALNTFIIRWPKTFSASKITWNTLLFFYIIKFSNWTSRLRDISGNNWLMALLHLLN